jgi:hypothetical protein
VVLLVLVSQAIDQIYVKKWKKQEIRYRRKAWSIIWDMKNIVKTHKNAG